MQFIRINRKTAFIFICFMFFLGKVHAEDKIIPGKLEYESPTLHCLGFRWLYSGDDNRNSSVTIEFRKEGEREWRKAMPLRRVETEAMEERKPENGQGLFAGSILFLEPGITYDIRLFMHDPDGGEKEEAVSLTTIKEPEIGSPKRTLYVSPGSGGGNGSRKAPFLGFDEAMKNASPGDHFVILGGEYKAPVNLQKSGTKEDPIVWKAERAGEAVILGSDVKDGFGLQLNNTKYVFVEGLSVKNVRYAIRVINSENITIRGCRLENVGSGIFGDGAQKDIFIANNTLKGPMSWPPDKSDRQYGEARGIELSGTGHVVCYNRVSNFRDGIDTRGPYPVRGIDIHNNEISECTDDGIELDYSEHNCRAFLNRITNVTIGISFQPSRGGPNYAVRNVLYNISHETWKLHLTPVGAPHRTSGGVIMHNTVVKSGPCFRVWSNEGPAHYFYLRNNLYIGIGGSGSIEITCPMLFADMDYNGYFHYDKSRYFAYWNKKRYQSIEEFAKEAGLERHGLSSVFAGNIFSSVAKIPEAKVKSAIRDFRLHEKSPAIDIGEKIPSINDDYKGAAPDLGAYEFSGSEIMFGSSP